MEEMDRQQETIMELELAVDDANDRLNEIVRRVEAGEKVVLTRDGRSVARLVSVRFRPSGRECDMSIKEIRASAAAKIKPGGTDGARSQDFLYDENGLPG